MVFIVLWCLIFNKTSKFWMCKKIETEALQEKKQTKKHQNPQYWQLYILKYSLRPISKKSYLMLQIVNTSILNNFCWLFLKTYMHKTTALLYELYVWKKTVCMTIFPQGTAFINLNVSIQAGQILRQDWHRVRNLVNVDPWCSTAKT